MNDKTYNILLEIKENTTKEELLKVIKKNEEKISRYRVWVLTGKKENNNKEEYLLVAQTENIIEELKYNIKVMFNDDYLIKDEYKDKVTFAKTEFGQFPYIEGDSKHKADYKIRYIKEEYKELIFYGVDLCEYLKLYDKINISDIENETVGEILKMSADYYVEAKIAYKYEPKYWNYYRSGVGKRTWFMLDYKNAKECKNVES